jgi:hypothetical protein
VWPGRAISHPGFSRIESANGQGCDFTPHHYLNIQLKVANYAPEIGLDALNLVTLDTSFSQRALGLG